jgi:cytochrome b6
MKPSVQGVREGTMRVVHWLDERFGASELLGPLAKKKEVPVHKHTFWYYLGGMVLFLFILQVSTGVLLLFYYRPSAEGAYESVQFLMSDVRFGWLIRSIHAWGANLMIFMMFVHLFSVFLLKAYRKPRELTWMTGMALFGVVLGLGFTGYLLPWNTLSYFATRVGTEIPGVLPVVGHFLLTVMRGGDDVTGATLTRFYALHVSVLPGLCFLFISLHVFLVQRHGMSVPPGIARAGGPKGSVKFFPNFLLHDLMGWLAMLACLASLAAFLPAHLGTKADPFGSAPAGIKPEWYFMFMFETLKLLPSYIFGIAGDIVGIVGFGLVGALLFLVPFIDRGESRTVSRVWTAAGMAMIFYIVAFTVLGYLVSGAPGT